jgi:hypothetical protein
LKPEEENKKVKQVDQFESLKRLYALKYEKEEDAKIG